MRRVVGAKPVKMGTPVAMVPATFPAELMADGSNAVIGRAGIEGVEGEMADEEILRERVIIKAPAGADHGVAIAAQDHKQR